MQQKRLYKLLDNIIKEAPNFETDQEILTYVLNEIIKNEEIDILGGRIWAYDEIKKAYVLKDQVGDVELIDKEYTVEVDRYPMFKEVGQSRSVLAQETDEYLLERGIYLYSATGVGERYRFRNKNNEPYYLYKYLIALNAKKIDESLINTLNIISTTLSSLLRSLNIEYEAKENLAELEKAREIQRNILPEHELKFGEYEIFGVSIPAKIVGGDFFDYLTSEDDDRIGIAIGDAASKGISAAAQALYVSGALKMGVAYQSKMTTMIKKINQLVYRTFPFERFVTLFYCELYDDKRGLCQFVNAGHNSPMLLKAKTGEIELLGSTGSVLGPSPNQAYTSDSFYFSQGDILLLYTDGIVEANNEKFEFYGDDKLINKLKEVKDNTAMEICELIIEDIEKFSAHSQYADDKTVVVIKKVK